MSNRTAARSNNQISTVVDVSARQIVAQGNRRNVYLIAPEEVGLALNYKQIVLKVPRYAERRAHPSPLKRLIAKAYPQSLERVITVEAAYWQSLAAWHGGDPATMPLPVFYGYVQTSEGRATLWECIEGENGALAPSMDELLDQDALASAIDPLNNFVDFCFRANLVAPDIRSGNVVLAHRRGKPEAVLIDGFGDMRLFSIRSLSPTRNKELMTKRLARMAWTIGLSFDESDRRFSMPQAE